MLSHERITNDFIRTGVPWPLHAFFADQPITFSAEVVGFVLHAREQCLGCGRADACAMQFLDVGALAPYLHAHPLDLDADKLKFHLTTRLTDGEQTKNIDLIGQDGNCRMSAAPEPNAQTETERLDAATDQAIAACGGDMRSTIRALILANEYLEYENGQLAQSVSKGYSRREQIKLSTNRADWYD